MDCLESNPICADHYCSYMNLSMYSRTSCPKCKITLGMDGLKSNSICAGQTNVETL